MGGRRIGILGGTFDPIHWGHLEAATAAQSALHLTRVVIVASSVPPHRPQPRASAYHRFAMVSLAVAGRSDWRASDLELREDGRSFTAATLRKFHERGYSPAELYFIIGADAFADIASWMDYPAILEFARFAVVSRPGYPVSEVPRRLPQLAERMARLPLGSPAGGDPTIVLINAPTADVSSTVVRDRLAQGGSIGGLVPDPVRRHIEQHELYATPPGRRLSDEPEGAGEDGSHGQD